MEHVIIRTIFSLGTLPMPLYQGLPEAHKRGVLNCLESHGAHYPMSVSTPEACAEARIIARHILETYWDDPIPSLVDVGTAGGHLVLAWIELGGIALGIDAHPDAPLCLGAPILLRDATQELDILPKANIVTCLDTAEHVEEHQAEGLIKNLTLIAQDTIIFSAAPPLYAGAHGHVNCQEPNWWEAKFKPYGWVPQVDFQDQWKEDLRKKIEEKQSQSFLWWVWSAHSRIFRRG